MAKLVAAINMTIDGERLNLAQSQTHKKTKTFGCGAVFLYHEMV